MRRTLPALLLAACTLAPATRAQQPRTDTTVFVVLNGSTPIVRETQLRSDGRLRLSMFLPSAGTRVDADIALRPDARMARAELVVYRAPGDTSPVRQSIDLRGDSALITVAGITTRIATTPQTLLWINPSPSVMEQVAMRARAVGGSAVDVPLLTGAQMLTAHVTMPSADSTLLEVGGVVIRMATSGAGRLLGAVVPSQGLRIVRGDSAAAAGARRAYSAPSGAPYRAEEVSFTSPEGIRIAGTLTLPRVAKGRRVPAAVTLTGSGQQDRDESLAGIEGYALFRQVADTLGRRGIAVLRIDDRGKGTSGDPATETSADYADDIRAAIAYLRARPEVDGARIAVIGHSEGGMVAPMVAASDARVRGVVLLAGPARNGRRIMEYQLAGVISRAPAAQQDSLRRLVPAQIEAFARAPWFAYFFAHDPLAVARKVPSPVLILQGGYDIQITPDQAPELAAAFRAGGNRRVTMKVFPTLNHLFLESAPGDANYAALPSKVIPPRVMGAIADWLVRTLR